MELLLKIDNKLNKFTSGTITFGRFAKSTELLNKYIKDEFLADSYPMEELYEARKLICDYFNCNEEQFDEGFEMKDSSTFFAFFLEVLQNIQLNDGKREVDTDHEGK